MDDPSFQRARTGHVKIQNTLDRTLESLEHQSTTHSQKPTELRQIASLVELSAAARRVEVPVVQGRLFETRPGNDTASSARVSSMQLSLSLSDDESPKRERVSRFVCDSLSSPVLSLSLAGLSCSLDSARERLSPKGTRGRAYGEGSYSTA